MMFASILLFLSAIMSGGNIATYAVVNPCPHMVVMGDHVTLVCDDGSTTFDLSRVEPGTTFKPNVTAGSHTVWNAVLTDNGTFRVWVDDKFMTEDGVVTSFVTDVDIVSGEVVSVIPK